MGDRELHTRLITGDHDALAEVYDRCAGLVYGIAQRLTGDQGAAEDITQDVFMTLWEKPERFDPQRGILRAWLCAIAHRRALDWLRRHETRRRYTDALARERVEPPTVEEGVVASAVARLVRAAVSELPAEQRRVIALAYFSGLTHTQIAAELRIPAGTAKSRIRLGLRHISTRLSQAGFSRD